jgi:hypothetical protein
MGALEPIELPETPLIIGDNFPTHDETAYAREADGQRVAAHNAGGAGGAALAAARYTDPQFRGLAGRGLTEVLTGHQQTLSADESRHRNVAAWMDRGAENIAQTKKAMNSIAADYHATYETLTERAHDETWPQTRLRQEKDRAVAEAQARVQAARAAFDDRHRAVSAAVVNGDDAQSADGDTATGAKQSPPASELDARKWKPGDKRHMPVIAGPGGLGPANPWGEPGWLEIGSQSGNFVRKDELPHVQVLEPGALGPATVSDEHGNLDPFIELGPNTGVWAPQSDFPGAKFYAPGSSDKPPFGWDEFLPGSGIYLWHGDLMREPNSPHSADPGTYPQSAR